MQLAMRARASGRRLSRAVVALAAVAVLVAGCTSSSSTKSSPNASPVSGSPVAPSRLVTVLTSGLADINTAHVVLRTALSGEQLSGNGNIELADGTVKAAQVSQQLPGGLGTVEIIVADATTYAKLPAALHTGGKPWTIIDRSSSNATVSSLSGVINTVLTIATPHGLIALAKVADSVTSSGPAVLNGTTTTHYSVRVDPSGLGQAAPDVGAGSGPVIFQVYVDRAGRPVRVDSSFRILGQQVAPHILLSRFGEPVSVSPPPPSDVSRT